jgi:hypothetical protein
MVRFMQQAHSSTKIKFSVKTHDKYILNMFVSSTLHLLYLSFHHSYQYFFYLHFCFIFFSLFFYFFLSSKSQSMWVTRWPPVSMCLRTCASVLVFILLFLYTVRISHRFNLSSLCPHSPIVPPASDLTYCLVLGCTTVVFNRVSLSLHWLLLSLASY